MALNLVGTVESAIPTRTCSKFAISSRELAYCLIAISYSEGSLITSEGAVLYQSKLVLKGNNPFGIKGRGIKTKTKEFVGGEYVTIDSEFASFSSVEECIKYLTDFIGTNKRYSKARKAITGEAFLRELQKAGYATSPDWFERFTIPMYTKLIHSEFRKNSITWTVDNRPRRPFSRN